MQRFLSQYHNLISVLFSFTTGIYLILLIIDSMTETVSDIAILIGLIALVVTSVLNAWSAMAYPSGQVLSPLYSWALLNLAIIIGLLTITKFLAAGLSPLIVVGLGIVLMVAIFSATANPPIGTRQLQLQNYHQILLELGFATVVSVLWTLGLTGLDGFLFLPSLMFLLFTSGYVLSNLLLEPGKIDVLERTVVSVLLSLVIFPVWFYIMNQIGAPITSTAIAIANLGLSGLLLIGVVIRNRTKHSSYAYQLPLVIVMQNVRLNEPKPLSIFLTQLLRYFPPEEHAYQRELILSGLDSDLAPSSFNQRKLTDTKLYTVLGNIQYTIRAYWSLLGVPNTEQTALVIHALYPSSSLMAAVAYKLLHNPRTRIIYDVRSPWIEMMLARKHITGWHTGLLKRIAFALERFLCVHVDHFVFVSIGLSQYYVQHFGVDLKHADVIPSAVSLELFTTDGENQRDKLLLTNDDILLGYVGTIDDSRELNVMLAYFIEAFADQPQIRLIMIGDGNARHSLESQAAQAGFHNRIIFKGTVPHSEVPSYIRAFDYGMVHTPNNSVYAHGSPLKSLEYLACGVRVLAFDQPSHQELARAFQGVAIYRDAKTLAEAVRQQIPAPNPQDLIPYTWPYIISKYIVLHQRQANVATHSH